MRPRRIPNPKRRLRPMQQGEEAIAYLKQLATKITYGGNPEHKRNPGDFGLQPPSQPRQGKTLCDEAEIFTRCDAQSLLREGARRGVISVQERDGWPQNVWAIAPNGIAVEAMLENSRTGQYHGYPMLEGDPLADEVRKRWGNS
jgi:hypothetical protein